ncbi:flagellar biosynthesis protein FliQ [Planctomycetota bacterium]
MDSSFVLYLGRHALETTLLLSAPLLMTCLVSGIAITLIQAVTSIRDMTLTIVPKLLAVGLVLMLFGNWMLSTLVGFFNEIFAYIQGIGH